MSSSVSCQPASSLAFLGRSCLASGRPEPAFPLVGLPLESSCAHKIHTSKRIRPARTNTAPRRIRSILFGPPSRLAPCPDRPPRELRCPCLVTTAPCHSLSASDAGAAAWLPPSTTKGGASSPSPGMRNSLRQLGHATPLPGCSLGTRNTKRQSGHTSPFQSGDPSVGLLTHPRWIDRADSASPRIGQFQAPGTESPLAS